MIPSCKDLGWVQKMMGHSSLKMITDKYFSYIPNMTHNDRSKVLEEYEKKVKKEHNMLKSGDPGQQWQFRGAWRKNKIFLTIHIQLS